MERHRSFLFFSFLFFSCDKSQEVEFLPTDKSPTSVHSLLKESDFFDGMSPEEIDLLLDQIPENNSLVLGGGGEGTCDCSYKVKSFTTSSPTTNPVDINFSGLVNPAPRSCGCDPNLNLYFEYIYNPLGICNADVTPCTNWPAVDPNTLPANNLPIYPINCTYEKNSPIFFGMNSREYITDPCDPQTFSSGGEATITFVMYCSESSPSQCLDGGGYGFSSGEITLTKPAGTPALFTFTLGGECGCTPIFQ